MILGRPSSGERVIVFRHKSVDTERHTHRMIKYASSDVELEAIKAIYRLSKRELGFLPDGAFQERFDRRQILIVVVEGKKTVELRKRRPSAELGSMVAIYPVEKIPIIYLIEIRT